MGNRFASGKNAIAECDRCGFRYKLKQLKKEVVKTKTYNLLVCPTCWTPDQPQLQLGMYPVSDPQAVREPRRDNSYLQAGYTGLQLTLNTDFGDPSGGSRVFQWGWAPIGGARADDTGLTPNDLIGVGQVGNLTVVIS
jgi:hypothetical protein